MRRATGLGLLLLAGPAAAAEPVRLDDHLPPAVRLSLAHRSRMEGLHASFRRPGDDWGLFLRTSARLRLGPENVGLLLEGMDARRYGAAEASLPTASQVNAVDLLQAQVQLAVRPGPDDLVRARLGRMTLDVGSRRLVARNHFRNTVNAFTGLDLEWTGASDGARLFAVTPVRRLPTAVEDVAVNRVVADAEALGTWLIGGHVALGTPNQGEAVELLVLGLIESDTPTVATRDRRLLTTTLRYRRAPAAGHLDGEVELGLQSGRSRADLASTEDLAHRAGLVHAHGGFTLDKPARWRIAGAVDLASGDGTPDNARQRRFDTLFGARRFELGPTGIHGAFARSNLISTEIQLGGRPHARVEASAAWRPGWLAGRRDGWVGTPLQDPDGTSGRFLGHQIEVRAAWEVAPDNVTVEAGGAWLARGRFAREAPGAPGGGDPLYGYAQVALAL